MIPSLGWSYMLHLSSLYEVIYLEYVLEKINELGFDVPDPSSGLMSCPFALSIRQQ
jgi:hypothetical protein